MTENYKQGAKRSDKKFRFRDVGLGLIRRIAAAFSEGALKYETDLPPYQKNWKRGDLNFALDVFDHAFEHLFWHNERILCRLNGVDFFEHVRTIVGDEDLTKVQEIVDDDHLGHLGANMVMLDYFEGNLFQGDAGWITPIIDDNQLQIKFDHPEPDQEEIKEYLNIPEPEPPQKPLTVTEHPLNKTLTLGQKVMTGLSKIGNLAGSLLVLCLLR